MTDPVPGPRVGTDSTVTLVDSNVVLDVLTDDPMWGAWSQTELGRARDVGRLVINPLLTYRQRGGLRRSPLADFYIGAHAAVRRYRLLTRYGGRYATYFPTLELIVP
jgi:hypothetical protein